MTREQLLALVELANHMAQVATIIRDASECNADELNGAAQIIFSWIEAATGEEAPPF